MDNPAEDQLPLAVDTPLAVELTSKPSVGALDTFTTSEFTLSDLYDISVPEANGPSEISDDLPENFTGFTDDQVESILSDTDLKALEDKKSTDDLLEELVRDVDTGKSFLCQGRSPGTRAGSGRNEAFGCSVVDVRSEREAVYVPVETRPPPPATPPPPPRNEIPATLRKPAPPPPRRPPSDPDTTQIVTVAVSDSLKVHTHIHIVFE